VTTLDKPSIQIDREVNRGESDFAELASKPVNQAFAIDTRDDLKAWATMISRSGMAPKGMETPEKIMVAMAMADQLGMPHFLAIQKMAVINGRASLPGSLALALVRRSGKLSAIEWGYEGTEGKDDWACWVESKRTDQPLPVRTVWSVADAKKAGLWGKTGPWSQYTKRMMFYRSLGFNLDENFSDVLFGLVVSEVAPDYPDISQGDRYDSRTPFDAAKIDAAKGVEGLTKRLKQQGGGAGGEIHPETPGQQPPETPGQQPPETPEQQAIDAADLTVMDASTTNLITFAAGCWSVDENEAHERLHAIADERFGKEVKALTPQERIQIKGQIAKPDPLINNNPNEG